MSDSSVPVTIRVLDKELRIACPPSDRASLLESADLLNKQISDLKNSGKVVGTEKLLIMAALNITHESLQERNEMSQFDDSFNKRCEAMQHRIEDMLHNLQQMEIA